MLNTDLKIFSKALAVKVKPVFPSSIASLKSTFVQNWCTDEVGRLVSDILDNFNKINI